MIRKNGKYYDILGFGQEGSILGLTIDDLEVLYKELMKEILLTVDSVRYPEDYEETKHS